MARVVGICGHESYDFKRRQIPIEVDNVKMVVQFSETCVDCGKLCRIKQKDLDHFTNKFRTLTKDEVAVALMVPGKEMLNVLPLMVPCIGCRKSVERLFYQLQKSQHKTMEPLIITPQGELSIQHEYLFDPRSLFSLFHVHGPKLHAVMEPILHNKRSKRCCLHSLDNHKYRALGHWLDLWDVLSHTCREKVLVVEMNQLVATVDKYLEKHKFCTECKSKVMLAYNICVGQHDGSPEEGYCPALFENLRWCPREQHIHVLNNTDFISDLLDKAEPEFFGGNKERHAKTLDIAQEEILTCLGIHIFDRLQRISQTLRNEEQTWLILLHIGVDVLRKSYQVALEKKQGASELELLCEMLQEKDKRQGAKQQMKKQKRKQKKDRTSTKNASQVLDKTIGTKDPCLLPDVCPDSAASKSPHHIQDKHSCGDANSNTLTVSLPRSEPSHQGQQATENKFVYSAIPGSCQSCSICSTNNTSKESTCSDSCPNTAHSCQRNVLKSPSKLVKGCQTRSLSSCNQTTATFQSSEQPSLQDLLDVMDLCCTDDKDDDVQISEEEIIAFKAQQVDVDSKRQKLRENLRQRFENLYLSRPASTV